MDPEKLPLLAPTVSQIRILKSRPLTHEEVANSQVIVSWRRARLSLVLIFWATMAMFLSIIVSMLMKHDCVKELGPAPSVPPVHMSFAPLMH
ncbi:jg26986 [Pararge aegeria aegeria]|uniref:Jg26986 protein n=1 Tax=Pararge aegeria aegeria TaxID=348720 RepID=A0A8S4RW40_9NEOP|nr:jg26986 [Pararge aegeria aegeria]